MSILTRIRKATRQAVTGYLEAAEERKSKDYCWIPWYDFSLRYFAMIFRDILVAVVITLSLVLSFAHAITEGYPKGVKKPTELVIFTAIAVTIKLAGHIAIYMLAVEACMFRKYGRTTVVATGCVSAGLKGIEGILIYVLVDGGIPEDTKCRFSMCALAFAEGLLAAAAGMAFTGPEVVAFDSPGDVFDGFGSRSRFPRLTIQEKRILIEAVIIGEHE
jgi:hypothetical protein